MVDRQDARIALMTRNLKDLGLSPSQLSAESKCILYADGHFLSLAGKMFEDQWED